MRVLIDTHTFLWFIEENPRLSMRAKYILEEVATTVEFSAASAWELAIKASIGQFDLHPPIYEFVSAQLEMNIMHWLAITLQHISIVSSLPLHHRDPFDRMLIAQAMVERIPILSADAAFDAYPVQRIW